MKKGIITFVVLLCANILLAQTTIRGSVYDIYLETVSAIKVSVNNESTRTDNYGSFTLKLKEEFPFNVVFSGVGYKTKTVEIFDLEELTIVLEKQSKLQEIVISASRTPERIFESPVTVERMGKKEIKNTTSLSFYDDLANLRDVDVNISGFSVKSINTRAFASIDNVRFLQLVDGADTANPSYNFSLGNTMGLNDLDVASVEVLPGATSALYGANAFNGVLLMNSKNPFDYGGISTSFKTGFSTQQSSEQTPFYDTSIRMAHAFNNKVAIKANFNYLRAQEWEANNISNTTGLSGTIIEGTRETDPGYNGVNVYGDEIPVAFQDGIRVLEAPPYNLFPLGTSALLPTFNITRTGFNEVDLINDDINLLKFDASIYYRPTGKEDVELVFNSKYGYGDNTYRKGNTRISQEGAFNQQHKIDFKYKNYLTTRVYYTNFDQGESAHNLLLLGYTMNTAIKEGTDWYTQYTVAYTQAYLTAVNNNVSPDQANILAQSTAKAVADSGRPTAGTAAFQALLNDAKTDYISASGGRLRNNSHLYHGDLNLNLTDFIKVFGLQLGGSYRRYKLSSGGELYTDFNSPIIYDEFGTYAQGTIKAFDKRLSIASSIRYDKSRNFDGNFSPRVSLTFAAGKNRNHNIRLSYQTAFRNPTTEDQYGGFNLGASITAIGNIEENYIRYATPSNPLLGANFVDSVEPGVVTITGDNVLNNSYTLESQEAYNEAVSNDLGNNEDALTAYTRNIGLLEIAKIEYLRPEKVQTFELGYRGELDVLGNIFEIDFNAYYSKFDDYITTQLVATPYYGDVNSTTDINAALALNFYDYTRNAIRVNTAETIDFYGSGITIGTRIFNSFDFSANYMFSQLRNQQEVEETLKPGFNTAKHRAKVSFGKDDLFNNFGFKINARWQDRFLWQSPFLNGYVNARTVLDAQINLTVPVLKSNFKLGGTNLTGNPYTSAPGLGTIGSLYYINWTINN